jgi:DNA/RNA endonuclease YhcR with UshA esterase domain
MKTLSRSLFLAVLFCGFLATLQAQTATVIPDTEAAQHVGHQATVEGTVVKVFTSKNGNTFLNFGAAYPNQTFTAWIPKGSPVAAETSLFALEGKRVRITGTIPRYKGKPEIRIASKEQIVENQQN